MFYLVSVVTRFLLMVPVLVEMLFLDGDKPVDKVLLQTLGSVFHQELQILYIV